MIAATAKAELEKRMFVVDLLFREYGAKAGVFISHFQRSKTTFPFDFLTNW